MTLERLVEEIRSRGAADLASSEAKLAAERIRLTQERDRRIAEVTRRLSEEGEREAARVRAQKVAGARMQARKLEYEARERALTASLGGVRDLLVQFTRSSEYPDVLERMYDFAVDALGKGVRVSGRAEDASALKALAGKAFNPQPQPILGGLIAETPDGARRLTLTLDELLRLREDKARELLA